MKELTVAGFLFSPDKKSVALIRKNRPEWQRGFLNAIGGHIEEGEHPANAMSREFKEETGIVIQPEDWRVLTILYCREWEIIFYTAYNFSVYSVKSKTDEEVCIIPTSTLPASVIYNLNWLIPLALDIDVIRPVPNIRVEVTAHVLQEGGG